MLLFGMPQVSILGPLLFDIVLSDLLLFQINAGFVSYADNNTLYSLGKSPKEVITKLEESS